MESIRFSAEHVGLLASDKISTGLTFSNAVVENAHLAEQKAISVATSINNAVEIAVEAAESMNMAAKSVNIMAKALMSPALLKYVMETKASDVFQRFAEYNDNVEIFAENKDEVLC